MNKWSKLTLISLMLILLGTILLGCQDEQNIGDIDKSIKDLKVHINTKEWDKAADEVKDIDDYFQFIRFNFTKDQLKAFDDLVKELDLSVSDFDKTKSMGDWEKVNDYWQKLIGEYKKANDR